MEGANDILLLEKEINTLRQKLDNVVDTGPMNSGEVLELSRKLDELIVGYYNLKYDFNSR